MVATRNGAIYEHEMTDNDHENLLDHLLKHSVQFYYRGLTMIFTKMYLKAGLKKPN
ncbi:hypothetical protein [Lysinibacillus sp. Y5S-8]|uniref:hypothetical protein n=1 Tax=Lysinibacillus sp. Y5S-8 TaxID=3122488 RepID=UPI001646DE31